MECLKALLKGFNSFQSQQFFRFNGQPQFTNIMGGVFTLMIRVLLLGLLIVKLINVFKFETVILTQYNTYQVDPINQTLSPINASSPFLVIIQVTIQYSQLNLTQLLSNYSLFWTQNTTNAVTFLQACTPQHWAVAPTFYQTVKRNSIQFNSALFCLPINYTHQMSIEQSATLQINYAFKCKTNCTSLNYTSVLVRPIILNTHLNSQLSQGYISSFLDQKTWYPIDTQTGASFDTCAYYYLENYQIITDTSLLPWAQYSYNTGFFIPNQPIISYRPNLYPSYAVFRMFFQLNSQQQLHRRSFTKIFDAISQVGGLVPVLLIAFMWLNFYALAHFEMSFIKKIHSDQKAKEYGLFYFISKFIYSFLSLFKFNLQNWEATKQYHKMHKTVNKLIDVIYLYKRLEFIERALEVLFDTHQIKVLHLMRNKTFKEAECNYELYNMKQNLQKFIQKKRIWVQEEDKKLRSMTPVKEISLKPNAKSQNIIDNFSSAKNLIIDKQIDGEMQEWPPRSHNLLKNQQSAKKEPPRHEIQHHEQDSEINSQIQRQQMNDLRDAFSCYERLRVEAEDSNSQYFSLVSRNIFNRLNNVDKQLLDELETLLREEQKDQLIAKVMDSLHNKEIISLEESLFKRKSSRYQSYIKNSKQFGSLRISSTKKKILNSDHQSRKIKKVISQENYDVHDL